ncbi:DMT family protein [Schlesneria sp. DSM 10557]|uniref:DMT family protein n=1 Tax=Schlesneria sp. DSM 10557 TaxID=3044399 RepID=UPI00359F85FA
MLTVLLLTISNVFMTFAWYGHLKHKESPIFVAIIVSWLIAFFEYCFQVPANRWGSSQFTPVQLKIMQEVITLVVFSIFAVTYLNQKLGWNHLVAFLLIVGAVFFVRMDKVTAEDPPGTLQAAKIEPPHESP